MTTKHAEPTLSKTVQPCWLSHINNAYYFKYIYKSYHVLNYHEEELDILYEKIKIFKKYNTSDEDAKDYFQIRQIVSALYNRVCGHKTTFPIDKLSPEEVQVAIDLMSFCQTHIFYPWDIKNIPDYKYLLNFVRENKNLPIIPPIFNWSEETENMDNNTFFLSDKSYFVFSNEFMEEMYNFFDECEQLSELYDHMELKGLSKLYKKFYSRKALNPEKIKSNAKLRKNRLKQPYKGERSLWERLTGLVLWIIKCELAQTKINENCGSYSTEEKERIYKSISVTALISKLNEEKTFEQFLDDKQDFAYKMINERNIQRWLKATEESIKQGDYVPIK